MHAPVALWGGIYLRSSRKAGRYDPVSSRTPEAENGNRKTGERRPNKKRALWDESLSV